MGVVRDFIEGDLRERYADGPPTALEGVVEVAWGALKGAVVVWAFFLAGCLALALFGVFFNTTLGQVLYVLLLPVALIWGIRKVWAHDRAVAEGKHVSSS